MCSRDKNTRVKTDASFNIGDVHDHIELRSIEANIMAAVAYVMFQVPWPFLIRTWSNLWLFLELPLHIESTTCPQPHQQRYKHRNLKTLDFSVTKTCYITIHGFRGIHWLTFSNLDFQMHLDSLVFDIQTRTACYGDEMLNADFSHVAKTWVLNLPVT